MGMTQPQRDRLAGYAFAAALVLPIATLIYTAIVVAMMAAANLMGAGIPITFKSVTGAAILLLLGRFVLGANRVQPFVRLRPISIDKESRDSAPPDRLARKPMRSSASPTD